MITRQQLADLRRRMVNHDVVDDTAVVTITVRELQQLIEAAEKLLEQTADEPCFRPFGGDL